MRLSIGRSSYCGFVIQLLDQVEIIGERNGSLLNLLLPFVEHTLPKLLIEWTAVGEKGRSQNRIADQSNGCSTSTMAKVKDVLSLLDALLERFVLLTPAHLLARQSGDESIGIVAPFEQSIVVRLIGLDQRTRVLQIQCLTMYLFREHRRIEILLALCETHFGSFEFSFGPSQLSRCFTQGVLCLLHFILFAQASREGEVRPKRYFDRNHFFVDRVIRLNLI